MCHVSCQAMDKEDEIRGELQAAGRRWKASIVHLVLSFFLTSPSGKRRVFSSYFGDSVHTRWKCGIFLTLSRL